MPTTGLLRVERTLGLIQYLMETTQFEKHLSCSNFNTPTTTDAAR